MTFLSYTGRGRGGRGRGRGRGRGFPGRHRGGWAGAGRGRGASSSSSSSNKWVRPKEEKIKGDDDSKEASKPETEEVDKKSEAQQAEEAARKRVLTMKRSRNQLVVQSDGKDESAPPAQGLMMKHKGKHKLVMRTAADRTVEEKKKQLSPEKGKTIAAAQSMTRLGHNKLVLGGRKTLAAKEKLQQLKGKQSSVEMNGDKAEVSERNVEDLNPESKPEAQGKLKKAGPNKLAIPQKHEHKPSHKRSPPNSSRPGVAKRIKLTMIQPSTSEDAGSEEEDEEAQDAKETKTAAPDKTTEKLTDFAYRETSRVAPRGGQHRTWTLGGRGGGAPTNAGPRNMGLVRVQPDETKTRVCPVFLKGVECTDKYCRKRHDVPKEFAMPVCSFFQRHGQCLKAEGECMFRHVKVNPRATVCPSFALLGFCEDQDCAMRHVRTNNHSPPKNKADAKRKYAWRSGT